jgi:regulator of replication initiation timing
MATGNKTVTKVETTQLREQLKTQEQNTKSIKNRVTSLVDELFVLRTELDSFKKQVTNDLTKVVDGLQTVAKKQK